MATFTEAQISDLGEILEVNSNVLSDHLNYWASVITESDKTKVLSLVAQWQALDAANNGIKFTPTESNKGFNSDTGTKASSLKNRLAALLHWQSDSGSFQFSISRG